MRKFIEATRNHQEAVSIWGTGAPRREFMHIDDFADAALFLMKNFNDSGFVNVGTGIDLSIHELAERIAKITGYQGDIVYDTTKPDGMPRKLMDVSRLSEMGWTFNISLDEGLRKTYEEIKDTQW
jgi:GDP-L-fucose synthase